MTIQGVGKRRLNLKKKPRGPAATHELAMAYLSVFDRRKEDVQMVLADLADITGFYAVSSADTPPDARAYADGKRAAFGRLFHFLNLTDEERGFLEKAARTEANISLRDGHP